MLAFRYFSSSLLLIYNGAECPPDLCRRDTEDKKSEERRRREECPSETEEKAENWKVDMKRDRTPPGLNVNAMPTSTESPHRLPSYNTNMSATPSSNIEATPISTCNGHLNGCVSPTSINRACGQRQSPDYRITCNGTSPPPTQYRPHENHIKGTPTISKLTSPTTAPTLMSTLELAEAWRHFDLRMIDFARSTHGSCYDRTCYKGLDECYLAGLDSLIGIFRKMMDNTSFSEQSNLETTKILS